MGKIQDPCTVGAALLIVIAVIVLLLKWRQCHPAAKKAKMVPRTMASPVQSMGMPVSQRNGLMVSPPPGQMVDSSMSPRITGQSPQVNMMGALGPQGVAGDSLLPYDFMM